MRRRMLLSGWLAALLAFAATARAAEPLERVEIAATAEDPVTLALYVARGTGNGPHPVVVALHGCDGLLRNNGELGKRGLDWAGRWTAAGYTVVMPESFRSRGLGSQCTVPMTERRAEPRLRARDVVRAAQWVATQPGLDAGRMALVGWSHGGGTVLATIASSRSGAGPEFRTAIAFYPGCRGYLQSTTWSPRLPLAILIGEKDDWTPAEPCRALAAKHGFAITVYPKAYHGFDVPDVAVRELTGLAWTTRDGKAHVGTEPEARAAAIAEVMRRLADALR